MFIWFPYKTPYLSWCRISGCTILISNRNMRPKLTNNWVRPYSSPWESAVRRPLGDWRTAYCPSTKSTLSVAEWAQGRLKNVSGFLLEFIPHRDAGQDWQRGDSRKLCALGCITPIVSKYTETSKKTIYFVYRSVRSLFCHFTRVRLFKSIVVNK